ncbi:uncharacterized protein ARMOST_10088 [Armillaria ostoyae]|uniref:Reverse transcriptase domain-containing protein n=1 Tax=Armillaria ostoyae TaxID=47428 RepID=A0A284RDA9_ARMOS|nr:uncharacterized protein ARMOST_10088 [Armillaria ostoyae]
MSLKGSNDRSPARAEAKAVKPAGHEAESLSTLRNRGANRCMSSPCGETQSMKVFGEKSPTIVTPIDTASQPRRTDGTWAKLKHTSCEASLQDKQAAPTRGSPITTTSVESRPDGALENTARNPTTTLTSARAVTRPGMGINRQPSTDSEGTGQTGNSAFAVQAPPIMLLRGGPLMKGEDDPGIPPLKEQGRSPEGIPPRRALAIGQEAASAQAVNRGHSVSVIEVPDEEDDSAYQIWLAKEQTPAVAKKEVTSDELARSSTKGNEHSSVPPTKSDPSRWLKPFEVDWMLHTVCEAQNDNAAHAALFVWTHRDRVPELTEELLSELHQGGERAWEQLYELREPPRYLRHRQNGDRDFSLDIQLNSCTGRQTLTTKALVDSGCTSSSINRAFVRKHELNTRKTAVPIAVYNADGTHNQAGDITEFVEFRMTIRNHSERIDFAVTDLGSKDLYLGHDWLKRHNLVINWEMGMIIFGHCQCISNPFLLPDADPDDRWDEELKDSDRILAVNIEEELVIRVVHHANDLAAAANTDKPKKTFEEMVPADYRSFRDLFSKENFDELPEWKPWDHAIELVPNAKSTLDCKVYPLNRDEQEQLDKFLDENLESGRIKESKSLFASPFFFVKKKDSSLRPVQDYRKLNEMTIKNRYPLPLISELIDKLQGAKYFTKLDVRWGYNNVRIKEGDEHKATFCTNRGLFEPTVMFFGLTNSPATFQWMMNDIFKDLISKGKVTIYLDDILIFTKDLDEH